MKPLHCSLWNTVYMRQRNKKNVRPADKKTCNFSKYEKSRSNATCMKTLHTILNQPHLFFKILLDLPY